MSLSQDIIGFELCGEGQSADEPALAFQRALERPLLRVGACRNGINEISAPGYHATCRFQLGFTNWRDIYSLDRLSPGAAPAPRYERMCPGCGAPVSTALCSYCRSPELA